MSDSDFPYTERFAVHRALPDKGRPREDVLAELRTMATEEDAFWETGKCSGTMYSGDHEHYRFLTEAFGMFAHVNVLQRDMCPSATKFEGEIIAMALDLLHADAVTDGTPGGLVTTGGSGSILHALLAYREHAAATRGVGRPNFVKPETGHPAFDKACRLLGVELRSVPVEAGSLVVDPGRIAEQVDDQTIAIMGSACNYGYGTIDPITELGQVALDTGVGLHVDGCLGGFILPFGEELGYDIPRFDFRVPGVTTISADTHKYGYSFKANSTLLFRDTSYRNAQYFHLPGWSGGKYMSPGIEGSRSGGLLAATWAAMVQLGREGYLAYARDIFGTADAMKDVVRSHPELRIMGEPTFCFSFTADAFDIYHVADAMRGKGWRFNGQQYPNAIHMAVTRPQTRPGVVDAFAADLDAGIDYAKVKEANGEQALSGAIYGGVPGGLTVEAEEFIVEVMDGMLDTELSVPTRGALMVSPGSTPGPDGYVLAVDLGSSGVKVALVSTAGEVATWTYRPLHTDFGPGGVATQDADEWWRLVTESARECLEGGPVDGRRVVAVCVTGQWASTVPVDADGRPVGPCLMWSDTQGEPHSREVVAGRLQGYRAGALADWVRRTAGVPSTSGADPLGHMLHLDRDDPATARAARWYLEPVDALSMRFTGVAAASPASMTAAWLTDNRHPDRVGYDPALVQRAGVDAEKLPPLVATGTVVAPVLADVAAALGISPGAVLVTGIPDLHAAAVGSGCVRDHEAHLSIGTTAWVSCPLPEKKTDLFRQMATVPGLTADRYLLGDNQETAGRCLDWLRGVLDASGYDELTALAATAPPGSGGVLFTPWLAGERSPIDDRAARGGFHNVSLSTTRADLVRAVLEGVAFNARWLLEGADRFTGRRLAPVRVVGGGALSLLWCQIVADVCGRPVERVAEPLLSGVRGVAIFAGVAMGTTGWEDVRALVPVDVRLEPQQKNRATYDRLFAEFPGLYRKQRRMFARLNGRRHDGQRPDGR